MITGTFIFKFAKLTFGQTRFFLKRLYMSIEIFNSTCKDELILNMFLNCIKLISCMLVHSMKQTVFILCFKCGRDQ